MSKITTDILSINIWHTLRCFTILQWKEEIRSRSSRTKWTWPHCSGSVNIYYGSGSGDPKSHLNYGSGRSESYLNTENNMLNHQFCNFKKINDEHFFWHFFISMIKKIGSSSWRTINYGSGRIRNTGTRQKKARHSDLCEAFLVVDSHSCFLSSIPSRSLSPPSAHVANTC